MMRTGEACVQHRDKQKSAALHKSLHSWHVAREPCATEGTVSLAIKLVVQRLREQHCKLFAKPLHRIDLSPLATSTRRELFGP